jgi:hypothetical protein
MYATKAYWGSVGMAPHYGTRGPVRGDWSASHRSRCIPGTQWRLGGSQIRSWRFIKDNFSPPLPGIEQRCFSCRASSLVTTGSAMPAAFCSKGLCEIGPCLLVSLNILLCCEVYSFRLFSDVYPFWGAFAISFVMSLCPSTRLRRTTRLALDGFSWTLTYEYLSIIYRENSSYIKIWQE